MKTKIIPFDLETAKKIQAGEIEGKIKTKTNKDVRIICWDRMDTETPIVLLVQYDNWEGLHECDSMGEYTEGYGDDARLNQLVLEVYDNEPQFKPFDKVLVRVKSQYADNNAECDYWCPAIFQNYSNTDALKDMPYHASGCYWNECLPYEGNEHLVGTTNKPKEE